MPCDLEGQSPPWRRTLPGCGAAPPGSPTQWEDVWQGTQYTTETATRGAPPIVDSVVPHQPRKPRDAADGQLAICRVDAYLMEEEDEQIGTRQDESQWIVAQRPLSAPTTPRFD